MTSKNGSVNELKIISSSQAWAKDKKGKPNKKREEYTLGH